jgi:hypothetical protein
MTDQETLEHLETIRTIRGQRKRWRRLCDSLRNEAQRTNQPLQSNRERCALCTQPERSRGLFTYRQRDGQELLVGHRCAEYLDYFARHPQYARDYCR